MTALLLVVHGGPVVGVGLIHRRYTLYLELHLPCHVVGNMSHILGKVIVFILLDVVLLGLEITGGAAAVGHKVRG